HRGAYRKVLILVPAQGRGDGFAQTVRQAGGQYPLLDVASDTLKQGAVLAGADARELGVDPGAQIVAVEQYTEGLGGQYPPAWHGQAFAAQPGQVRGLATEQGGVQEQGLCLIQEQGGVVGGGHACGNPSSSMSWRKVWYTRSMNA